MCQPRAKHAFRLTMPLICRVRTKRGVSRIECEADDTLLHLQELIAARTGIDVDSQTVTVDGAELGAREASLRDLGFRNGQQVQVDGELAEGKSAHVAVGERDRPMMKNGRITKVARSEVVCMQDEGQEGAWLCDHPEWQVCLNCCGAEKGEKVELEMLCQHGPDARCTNCLVEDSQIEGRKHQTFGEFMAKSRDKCEHAFSAVCNNCMPPSKISYKMKDSCDKHKPWPLGLCNECQPPPATLARQTYVCVLIMACVCARARVCVGGGSWYIAVWTEANVASTATLAREYTGARFDIDTCLEIQVCFGNESEICGSSENECSRDPSPTPPPPNIPNTRCTLAGIVMSTTSSSVTMRPSTTSQACGCATTN